ncbi:MAG: diguanylate cyclase [Thermoanaerobacteraceae bacterium]|nr:diguanylate cyclase [Thermoanaerobacteraceae bacterium]
MQESGKEAGLEESEKLFRLLAENARDIHEAGDERLKLAAGIIKKAVSKEGIAARIGDDEFAVIFDNCPREVIEDTYKKSKKPWQNTMKKSFKFRSA